MRAVLGAIRKAVTDYNMIAEGERIAVGVSGGKDSMLLLEALCRLQRFADYNFEVVAITIDPQFNNTPADFNQIQEICDKYGVLYHIQRSQLAEIIFEERKESNPCSLCARMRRGMIHDIAKEHGCTKLALGHHMDDAVETFMMNLTQEGRIGCFSPVTYLSRKDLTMIRPLVYLSERQVVGAVRREQLPVISSNCPVDGKTKREEVKEWLTKQEKGDFPKLRERIFGALQKSGIDGW